MVFLGRLGLGTPKIYDSVIPPPKIENVVAEEKIDFYTRMYIWSLVYKSQKQRGSRGSGPERWDFCIMTFSSHFTIGAMKSNIENSVNAQVNNFLLSFPLTIPTS